MQARLKYVNKEIVIQGIIQAVIKIVFSGSVACVADITNTDFFYNLITDANLSYMSFFEFLGNQKRDDFSIHLTWEDIILVGLGVAAHAPYSVSSSYLRKLKILAGTMPFCIHVAESQAEIEFMLGYGNEGVRLRKILLKYSLSRRSMQLTGLRSLWHLAVLGILDQYTLVVHGVQFTKDEVFILAKSGASLCLCPRSNLALTGKLAPIKLLQKVGVNLALGTDSLASVPDYSLWAEMKALKQADPSLEAGDVLTMATLGSARALGLDGCYGSLRPGMSGPLIFVPLAMLNRKNVLEAVIMHDSTTITLFNLMGRKFF